MERKVVPLGDRIRKKRISVTDIAQCVTTHEAEVLMGEEHISLDL